MADDARTNPAPGSAESHWGTGDPEGQPSRDAVIGLGRMVAEAKTRLGPAADANAICADLKARGVDADPAEVARCCDQPYC